MHGLPPIKRICLTSLARHIKAKFLTSQMDEALAPPVPLFPVHSLCTTLTVDHLP